MVKVTFTLDETTVEQLAQAATLRSIPKSQAVREAIVDYHAKGDHVSEEERLRKLRFLHAYMKQRPSGTKADMDRELRALRRSRSLGWQRPSDVK